MHIFVMCMDQTGARRLVMQKLRAQCISANRAPREYKINMYGELLFY